MTVTYPDGSTASADVVVRFVPVMLGAFEVPSAIAVTLPSTMPAITSTLPGGTVPAAQPLADSALTTHGRAAFERVMGACAMIQQDLVNDDLRSSDGSFRQIAMAWQDPARASAASAWYTDPVMFATPASTFGPNPNWSTIAHEMGHNATLNSRAAFRLGGKIDGNANAIVSVGGVLADPQLRLFRGTEEIAANDNWGGGVALAGAFGQVGAFALEGNSRDAALVVDLPPGGYSAQVSGVGAGAGVALVEVYELP